MRISDWSSDVCSSDLRKRITHRQARAPLISPQLVRAEARGELAKMPERLRLGHLREIGQIEHVDHESARRVELLSTGGELREIAPELLSVIFAGAENAAIMLGARKFGIPAAAGQ